MRKQRGISLVELMVSIAIGLILMTGVVQLFLSSRATYTTQQAISRVQETGRLAMEFMAQDIRMAGYMGCMSRNLSFTNTLNNSGSLAYNFDVGIEGVDFDGTAVAGYPADILANTDILVLRSANGNAVGIEKNNDSSQLFAENTGVITDGCGAGKDSYSGMCIGDILMVSDCSKARVFQATNLTDTGGGGSTDINVVHSGASFTPGNSVTSWGGNSNPEETFGPDSEIIKVNTVLYFIKNGTSGRPSLYQQIGTQAPLELLEGVEDMQLIYGRDTTNDGVPDSYQDATAISAANAWNDVMSVRAQLLVASTDDNVLQEKQPYTFNGTAVSDPGDRRLRQAFINTIGIRSRLP